ncbi:MAG: phosphoenolpyruvate--protein phosphotransferase [Spirochaetaceae bacterium]|jgi:phosphotransferase system enzyme I (PtsI)|nr:phosphoenolpyruvate--protein phosphotransferase [Spirochaetaceae bacterium]
MEQFSGKAVFPGIVFGKALLFTKPDLQVDSSPSSNPDAEWQAFQQAVREADTQLGILFEKTRTELGEEKAMIVGIQRMMLEDGDFLEAVERMIQRDAARAAHAVDQAGKQFYELFASMDDAYMRARAPDIADVFRRLTAILLAAETDFSLTEPAILIAEDLSPGDILTLDRKLIRAFVTCGGSLNSHTAILARILNIPLIVQTNIPLDRRLDGQYAVVDGYNGVIYLEPDAETEALLEEEQRKHDAERAALESLRGISAVTRDGRRIELAANISGIADLDAVLDNGAESIGLFRSEFLFLGRQDYPGEDEQFEVYRAAAVVMKGRRVVVRTLDIGADKQAPYFGLKKEENPALGLRAVRVCFLQPKVFKTQLRAIYRASAWGNIAILFPMIASIRELRKCREFAAEARAELVEQGLTPGEVEMGIMIETPAAALCAEELAREADFFSVGTNDLTQYTLAMDRQNPRLEPFMDTHHPAILRLLAMTAEGAARAGIRVGICGELAADPEMTRQFIDMGYEELSVAPSLIPEMRKRIREL